MNHSKIAAALHALADAFLADVESVEQAVTGKKGGKKAAPTPESQANVPVLTQETMAAADTARVAPALAPAPAAAPTPPPPPTITKDQLNKAVLAVAAKNRDAAVALLSKFGLTNTVNLPVEQYQAVYDAFEEEIAKIDAAAVQVAQASLV